jgi:hypothetical protein
MDIADAAGPDRVVDVDAEKKSDQDTFFWKICIFCEAHLRKHDTSITHK